MIKSLNSLKAEQARMTAKRARDYRARKRREMAINNAIVDALAAALGRANRDGTLYTFLNDLRELSVGAIESEGISDGTAAYKERLKLSQLAASKMRRN